MEPRARRALALAEGGLLAALSALLSLAERVLPVGGVLMHVAATVPIVLVTARHGRRAGAAAAAIASVLVAAVFGPLAGGNAWLSFLAFGVTLGWSRRRGHGVVAAVGLAAAAGFASSALMLAESGLVTGIQPLAAARVQMQAIVGRVAAALPYAYRWLHVGAGLQARAAAAVALAQAWLPQLTLLAVAGFVATYGVGFAILCYAADRTLARRLGDTVPQLPPAVERALGRAERNLRRALGVIGSRGRGARERP